MRVTSTAGIAVVVVVADVDVGVVFVVAEVVAVRRVAFAAAVATPRMGLDGCCCCCCC